ncbi:MAG: hypothetical protein AAF914_06140 [Pseudomonadota bacterium]
MRSVLPDWRLGHLILMGVAIVLAAISLVSAMVGWLAIIRFVPLAYQASQNAELVERLPDQFAGSVFLDHASNPKGFSSLGLPGDDWSSVYVFELPPDLLRQLAADGIDALARIEEWPDGRRPSPIRSQDDPMVWTQTPATLPSREWCRDPRTGDWCSGIYRTIFIGSYVIDPQQPDEVNRFSVEIEARIDSALSAEGGYLWLESNRVLLVLPIENLGVYARWSL